MTKSVKNELNIILFILQTEDEHILEEMENTNTNAKKRADNANGVT